MEKKLKESFWEASIEEVEKGYIKSDENIKCIVCEKEFTIGRIYEINSAFYDSEMAAKIHIQEEHGSMLEYLINMNSSFTGVSDVQRQLLKLLSKRMSDKEIAKELNVAQSTIRNHRYKLREKEKQAKLFLAMMELLSKDTKKNINKMDKETLCDPHKTATTVDDRFNITDKEKEKVISNYIDKNGSLKGYPSKEKRKIIVLEEITKNFSKGKFYSEKEINRILERIYEDYATLRRALVEYGFIERADDCSRYWIKE